MVTYPYVPNIGSLKQFITGITSTGVPPKLTQEELVSRGFKSTNDRQIVTVLKFINFVDGSGKPTENWNNYRNRQQSKRIIASSIKTAYSELFNLYPNAQEKDTEALRDFFSTRIGAGDQVLTKTVSTFKTLCEFGEFEVKSGQESVVASDVKSASKIVEIGNSHDRQLVINLNIQLQLPTTDNAEIYDKIFQSLKKNVLGS